MGTGRDVSRLSIPDRAHSPPPGALRPYDFPAVERSELANGVPVLATQVNAFPIVTVHVLLAAGGVSEDSRLAGLAPLTCTLLDAGAAGRSASEIAESIESLGVNLDAGASWDASYISLTALRSRLEPALDLLADLLRRPDFPMPEVDRLRSQRLAEILQRRSDPRSLANEAIGRFIYSPESPFSRALGGTQQSVQRLTRSDLVRFHAERFQPGGASVICAGDVSVSALTAMLDERLAAWSGATQPVRPPLSSPRSASPQVVIVDRPGAVQSEIRVGHVGVGRDTADYFPLIVVNAALGGMFSSRLNLNLRERNGYTYGASSGFTMRKNSGAFLVSTAVQTEVTEAAVREIFSELRGVREAPLTETELADARHYLAGVFPLRLQTTDGIASRLAELALHGFPDDYFDSYRDRILAVDAETAREAAVQHLRPEEAAVVIVGDASQLVEPLRNLGVAAVEVISPDSLEEGRS